MRSLGVSRETHLTVLGYITTSAGGFSQYSHFSCQRQYHGTGKTIDENVMAISLRRRRRRGVEKQALVKTDGFQNATMDSDACEFAANPFPQTPSNSNTS